MTGIGRPAGYQGVLRTRLAGFYMKITCYTCHIITAGNGGRVGKMGLSSKMGTLQKNLANSHGARGIRARLDVKIHAAAAFTPPPISNILSCKSLQIKDLQQKPQPRFTGKLSPLAFGERGKISDKANSADRQNDRKRENRPRRRYPFASKYNPPDRGHSVPCPCGVIPYISGNPYPYGGIQRRQAASGELGAARAYSIYNIRRRLSMTLGWTVKLGKI